MKFARLSLIALSSSLAVACARQPDPTAKIQAMERVYQIMDLPLPFKSIKSSEVMTASYSVDDIPERGRAYRHNEQDWSFNAYFMYGSDDFLASCNRNRKPRLTENEINNLAAKLISELSGMAKLPADSKWTEFTRSKTLSGFRYLRHQQHKGFKILGGGLVSIHIGHDGDINLRVRRCSQPKFDPTTVKNEAEAIAMIPSDQRKYARNPKMMWVNERFPSTKSYQLTLYYTVPISGNQERFVAIDTATKKPIRSFIQEKSAPAQG